MKVQVKIPAVGESITEVMIGEWKKRDGEAVQKNEVLLVLESDKATVEVVAEASGVLAVKSPQGATVPIGAIVGEIDADAKASASPTAPTPAPAAAGPQASASAPKPSSGSGKSVPLSPAVRRIVEEQKIDPSTVQGSGRGGRITKADLVSPQPVTATASVPQTPGSVPVDRRARRVPMTMLRRRIAERLVSAQHTAAILTTFNEVDMTVVNHLRERYKEEYKKKYGFGLGLMGIFVKSCVEALKEFPAVNAYIDGTDIIFNDFYNIGVAVGTEKGLVVPVVRDVDQMTVADVEIKVREFADKARNGKIGIDDLNGGTFTISNGGVYGSLMSTPILNPPQSGILGMHKIQDRAMVIDKKIEIRPMMYLALSYDHRIIDGKEAVSFLVKVKECIEDPERILLHV